MIPKIRSVFYAIRLYGLRSFLYNAVSILTSDFIVVSFQKSGKTKLRVMIAKALSLKYNIKNIKLDLQQMTWFRPIPNILISHGGSTKDNNRLNIGEIFKNKKIIYLVRDPRDIVVSLFHGSRTRDKVYSGNDISKFIRDPNCGFSKILEFLNDRASEMKTRKKPHILVKFENLKKDPGKELKRVLDFVGISVSEDIIHKAVEYGSFSHMRKMEMNEEIKDYRMLPGDKKDPNSYRTRKGKVGSHREELNPEDIAYVNNEMKNKLDPLFGYKPD